MPNPKRRHSNRRTQNRRAHDALKTPGMSECPKSMLTYGLPDISGISLQNTGDEQRLLKGLEDAIETFEPRLSRIRVTSADVDDSNKQSLTFHVEALLMIDPAPERIAFDTVLDITKGAYSVKEN